MQVTAYQCDQCREIIGEKKHFSIRFDDHSGVAVPPISSKNSDVRSGWQINPKLAGVFVHLCSMKCLTAFFNNLMTKSK